MRRPAGRGPLPSAGRALAERGPTVVVKDGTAGALAIVPDGSITTAPATPVTAIYTTGAGDTFDAAFVDSWLRHLPPDEGLRRAVRAGTFAVSTVGGATGQLSIDQLTAPEG